MDNSQVPSLLNGWLLQQMPVLNNHLNSSQSQDTLARLQLLQDLQQRQRQQRNQQHQHQQQQQPSGNQGPDSLAHEVAALLNQASAVGGPGLHSPMGSSQGPGLPPGPAGAGLAALGGADSILGLVQRAQRAADVSGAGGQQPSPEVLAHVQLLAELQGAERLGTLDALIQDSLAAQARARSLGGGGSMQQGSPRLEDQPCQSQDSDGRSLAELESAVATALRDENGGASLAAICRTFQEGFQQEQQQSPQGEDLSSLLKQLRAQGVGVDALTRALGAEQRDAGAEGGGGGGRDDGSLQNGAAGFPLAPALLDQLSPSHHPAASLKGVLTENARQKLTTATQKPNDAQWGKLLARTQASFGSIDLKDAFAAGIGAGVEGGFGTGLGGGSPQGGIGEPAQQGMMGPEQKQHLLRVDSYSIPDLPRFDSFGLSKLPSLDVATFGGMGQPQVIRASSVDLGLEVEVGEREASSSDHSTSPSPRPKEDRVVFPTRGQVEMPGGASLDALGANGAKRRAVSPVGMGARSESWGENPPRWTGQLELPRIHTRTEDMYANGPLCAAPLVDRPFAVPHLGELEQLVYQSGAGDGPSPGAYQVGNAPRRGYSSPGTYSPTGMVSPGMLSPGMHSPASFLSGETPASSRGGSRALSPVGTSPRESWDTQHMWRESRGGRRSPSRGRSPGPGMGRGSRTRSPSPNMREPSPNRKRAWGTEWLEPGDPSRSDAAVNGAMVVRDDSTRVSPEDVKREAKAAALYGAPMDLGMVGPGTGHGHLPATFAAGDGGASQWGGEMERDPGDQPKKVRQKRGTATDPHSVAARMRRDKISQRMKTLYSLVPNGQGGDTASMLEEAIIYMRQLQEHVKRLTGNQDKDSIDITTESGPATDKAAGSSDRGGTLKKSGDDTRPSSDDTKMHETLGSEGTFSQQASGGTAVRGSLHRQSSVVVESKGVLLRQASGGGALSASALADGEMGEEGAREPDKRGIGRTVSDGRSQ